MLDVLAPISGDVLSLSHIPDNLFSQGAIGTGLAIQPSIERIDVHCPIDGVVCKVRSHGIVLINEPTETVFIVHLGIGSEEIDARHSSFDMRVHKGQHVDAGTLICKWDVERSVEAGTLPYALVIAVQNHAPIGDIAKGHVTAGRLLFSLP